MTLLLINQLFGIEFSAGEAIVGFVALILTTAAIVKAVKEIRKDGWEPFKERWISPRRARRERQESLLAKVELMSGQITEVLKEVKPNGGESLKDRIINIDSKVENLVARNRHHDDTNDVATFHLDHDGNMIYSNTALRDLLDVEEGQLRHSNFLALIEAGQRPTFIREIEEAVKFKMPIDTIVNFKQQGPKFMAIRLQASPDVRHGGILKGFFGTASTP